jgi:hypothetical protein
VTILRRKEGGPDATVARGRWTPPAKSGTERGALSLCERERGRGGGISFFNQRMRGP